MRWSTVSARPCGLACVWRACTIVKPSKMLKKSDDQATLCVVVGYMYGGGGYRV